MYAHSEKIRKPNNVKTLVAGKPKDLNRIANLI
jgi:hypothetical protein